MLKDNLLVPKAAWGKDDISYNGPHIQSPTPIEARRLSFGPRSTSSKGSKQQKVGNCQCLRFRVWGVG